MIIPEKVKVGAKVYNVLITDNISLGTNYTGEIDYCKLEIRIRPMAKGRMEHDFLHELIHAIFDLNGHSIHDEREVDSIAAAIHMVVSDNPGIFESGGS